MIYRKYLLCRLSLFAADYFPFSFSLAFCFTKIVRETLCKFLYVYASLKCMFMQSIMVNRNVLEFLQSFPHLYHKRTIFLLFRFSLFHSFELFRRKQKQKRKSRIFAAFCRNMSVFVANKTLIFSVL